MVFSGHAAHTGAIYRVARVGRHEAHEASISRQAFVGTKLFTYK